MKNVALSSELKFSSRTKNVLLQVKVCVEFLLVEWDPRQLVVTYWLTVFTASDYHCITYRLEKDGQLKI